MALPPMTLEGIRPYLPADVNNALAKNYADDDIPQFFSEQGISITFFNPNDRNICMRWKRNEENNITEIFLRVILHNNTIVGLISRPRNLIDDYKEIIISENCTDLYKHSDFSRGISLVFCDGKKQVEHVEIPFNIDQIKNIEDIREFFASNPELLPANLRERVFAQEENNESINYKFLIGSLLAFAVISYIAIKILHKPPQAEVK